MQFPKALIELFCPGPLTQRMLWHAGAEAKVYRWKGVGMHHLQSKHLVIHWVPVHEFLSTKEVGEVSYLRLGVPRLPTDCLDRLPATLVLVGDDQPAADPSHDLKLSPGSKLRVEPTLDWASLQRQCSVTALHAHNLHKCRQEIPAWLGRGDWGAFLSPNHLPLPPRPLRSLKLGKTPQAPTSPASFYNLCSQAQVRAGHGGEGWRGDCWLRVRWVFLGGLQHN